MKNEKERIFAYSLAKEIRNEELAAVSGGAAGISYQPSVHPTGSSGQGVDAVWDNTWDW